MEQVRSSAKERRLRQRRSDARIRTRLAADAVLLGEHHASAVPKQGTKAVPCSDRIVALLEQVVAQQGALFTVIAAMSGWQAGLVSPTGFESSAAQMPVSSADGGAVVPQSSVFSGVGVQEGHAGYSPPSNSGQPGFGFSPVIVLGGNVLEQIFPPESVLADGPNVQADGVPLPHAGVAAPLAEGSVVGRTWRAGQGRSLVDGAPISFQHFLESDHYDAFRVDLTDEQKSYLETFRHIDFPVTWEVEDILARVLSRHPYQPDLLGFDISGLYALAMIRRGDVDWDRLGSGVSSMTPDCRESFFVDFVRRACNRGAEVGPGFV